MTLGERVKEFRVLNKMNQKQLAKVTKITQATISRIEAGKVSDLHLGAMVRLANAFDISLDVLAGRKILVADPREAIKKAIEEFTKELGRCYGHIPNCTCGKQDFSAVKKDWRCDDNLTHVTRAIDKLKRTLYAKE